jgi:ATP-dependent helicase/nuclease subunit A
VSEIHPGYAPLERYRETVDTQPSLVVLPVPAPYGDYGDFYDWKIEESLPDAVGAYVKWLIEESGWMVSQLDLGEKRVPIEARHICVLFRRLRWFRRDVTRPYIRALEAAAHPAHTAIFRE